MYYFTQARQKGKISIAIVSNWMIPYSDSKSNRIAVERALDFMYGWWVQIFFDIKQMWNVMSSSAFLTFHYICIDFPRFMDPLTRGDYPFSMRTLVGSRLPKFTEEESKMVKGSFDFIGLNYYTANYVDSLPVYNGMNKSYDTDRCVNQTGIYVTWNCSC